VKISCHSVLTFDPRKHDEASKHIRIKQGTGSSRATTARFCATPQNSIPESWAPDSPLRPSKSRKGVTAFRDQGGRCEVNGTGPPPKWEGACCPHAPKSRNLNSPQNNSGSTIAQPVCAHRFTVTQLEIVERLCREYLEGKDRPACERLD